MIIRKTDANNDWRFGKGKADYARDEQAIEQNVKSRIMSWVGDCFFAANEGVDWKARLDVGQDAALADEIKAILLKSEGVVGINGVVIQFDESTRAVRVSYDIETVFTPSFQRVIQQASGTVV